MFIVGAVAQLRDAQEELRPADLPEYGFLAHLGGQVEHLDGRELLDERIRTGLRQVRLGPEGRRSPRIAQWSLQGGRCNKQCRQSLHPDYHVGSISAPLRHKMRV